MAKKPEQSLDVLGQSLLSQQSSRRAKDDKRRRKAQKKLMIMGAFVTGQSLVNNALKRRTKEIADLGEMSKYRSKMQAENMSFYAPIFQSMEGEGKETYEDWAKYMNNNLGEYRSLQGHLSPLIMANAKLHIPGAADDKAKFDREYRRLKDDITHTLVEQAYTKHSSGSTYKELFNSGANEFAAKTGIRDLTRENIYNLLSNTNQNSLDAYKARRINEIQGNLDTSIFSREVGKSTLNALTFGLLKLDKGETNPFKRITNNQDLIPKNIQNVLDEYSVNDIVKKRFTSNYAILRNEKEAFKNDKDAKTFIENKWFKSAVGTDASDNSPWVQRVQRGTLWDSHRLYGTEREGGHRYLKERAGLMDELHYWVNQRPAIADEFIDQTGTLVRLLGDPMRPKMKEDIMDVWLDTPWVKELGITKGSNEYRQVLNSLDSVDGRTDFALDFVASLTFKHKWGSGYLITGPDRFDYDFTPIKSITEQKFKIVEDKEKGIKADIRGKKGMLKFETTDVYRTMPESEKVEHYRTYLNAIIQNQTRSNNTPTQLREVAMKFMKDIPPPKGIKPEEFLNDLIKEPGSVTGAITAIARAASELAGNTRADVPTPSPSGPEDYTTSGRIPTGAETIQLIDPSIIKVHPSIKQGPKLVSIMDYHLPRLKGDKDKNKAVVFNQFLPALFDTESKFKYNAKNSESSAYGGGQIIRTSLIPALNRLNKAGVKPKEENIIRENMSRIDSLLEAKRNELVAQGMTDETAIKSKLDELGRIEYFKFMDKANLSESLQQQLVLADLLEKKMRNEEGVAQTGVGDTLWNALFEAPTPEAQYRAALEIFYRGHHTDPDEDTIKVAEKRFRPYFFPQ